MLTATAGRGASCPSGGGEGCAAAGSDEASMRSDGGATAQKFHLFDVRVLQPLFGGPAEDFSTSVSKRLGENGGGRRRRGADGVELEPLSSGSMALDAGSTISPAEPDES